MKLYEIAADYQNLLDAIENGDIPEEALVDTLESITTLLEDKADNIACIIKELTAEAEAIKAEEDRLAERRKRKLKRAERLTQYLSDTLLQNGIPGLETARNSITFRKTPGKVVFDDEKAFIEWANEHATDFLIYAKPTVNKNQIKAAINSGEKIEGVYLESKLNISIK